MNCFRRVRTWFKWTSSDEDFEQGLRDLERLCGMDFMNMQRLQTEVNDYKRYVKEFLKRPSVDPETKRNLMTDLILKKKELERARTQYQAAYARLDQMRQFQANQQRQKVTNQVYKALGKNVKSTRNLEDQLEQNTEVQDQIDDFNQTHDDYMNEGATALSVPDDDDIERELQALADEDVNNSLHQMNETWSSPVIQKPIVAMDRSTSGSFAKTILSPFQRGKPVSDSQVQEEKVLLHGDEDTDQAHVGSSVVPSAEPSIIRLTVDTSHHDTHSPGRYTSNGKPRYTVPPNERILSIQSLSDA